MKQRAHTQVFHLSQKDQVPPTPVSYCPISVSVWPTVIYQRQYGMVALMNEHPHSLMVYGYLSNNPSTGGYICWYFDTETRFGNMEARTAWQLAR